MLVDLCVRQYQRGLPELQRDVGEPAEQHEPGERSFRALRPASACEGRRLLLTGKTRPQTANRPRAAQATVCAGAVEQIPQSADGAPHDCCQLFIPDCPGATSEGTPRDDQSSDCCLLLRATATVTAEP